MRTKRIWFVSGVLALLATTALAGVEITSDAQGNMVESVFLVGTAIPVTLSAATNSDAPLLGVEVDLGCTSEHVRIAGIEVNPAFSAALGNKELVLPAQQVRFSRVQPPTSIDANLGVHSDPAWLVHVQLEVMTDEPFISSLKYGIRAVTLSREKAETQTGEIVITSGDQMAAAMTAASAWTNETAQIVIEVQPAGGGRPVTTLAPDTLYELHYRAYTDHVQSYIAFVAGSDEGAAVGSTAVPSSGYWAAQGLQLLGAAGSGESDNFGPALAVPGLSEGLIRKQMIAPDFSMLDPMASGPSAGQLFSFTAGSQPGPMVLEFTLWSADWQTLEMVDMTAQVVLTVSNRSSGGESTDGAD